MTKRNRIGIVLALLALSLPATLRAQGPFRLPGLDGGELTEASLSQGAVIVVVWAGWSPRCRDIVARVNQLAGTWSGQARVVTINFQESAADARSFLSGQRLSAAVFMDEDGAFSKQNAVTTLPSLLVFRDGRNRYRGRLPDDPSQVITQALR